MKELKVLKEKSCVNCEHGVTVPPFPYECPLMTDGKWVHENGYCPKELICENWKENSLTGMEDTSEMWRNAPIITVD